jgi:hypothetical protein
MTAIDPSLEANQMQGDSQPLSQIASDPNFRQGFADGRAKRPIASHSSLYLEGYRQGVLRSSNRHAPAGP